MAGFSALTLSIFFSSSCSWAVLAGSCRLMVILFSSSFSVIIFFVPVVALCLFSFVFVVFVLRYFTSARAAIVVLFCDCSTLVPIFFSHILGGLSVGGRFAVPVSFCFRSNSSVEIYVCGLCSV